MYIIVQPWDPVLHHPGDAGELIQELPHRPDQA